MASTLDLIAPLARVEYASRDSAVYWPVPCPSCGYQLQWAIETPPIPLTLYRWFDPNGEGRSIDECSECGESLPEGDLTKEATLL